VRSLFFHFRQRLFALKARVVSIVFTLAVSHCCELQSTIREFILLDRRLSFVSLYLFRSQFFGRYILYLDILFVYFSVESHHTTSHHTSLALTRIIVIQLVHLETVSSVAFLPTKPKQRTYWLP